VIALGALLALASALVGTAPAGSTTSPATARDAPDGVQVTIAAAGDLLIHQPVWQRALAAGGGHRYNFRPLLRAVRPYLRSADMAICHVETPLRRGPPSGYPIFSTPAALAPAIRWAGFDVCSTASNHTLDRGQAGIDSTVSALDRAGVAHAGSYRSAAGSRQLAILTVKGVRIAFLSYTTLLNGLRPPHPWSVNLASPRRILSDARRARRLGADVVIVSLHWGQEYVHAPTRSQLQLADRLTRSPDVTAVIGQHVHVVQPIRRVNGKIVVFGEGNLVSNQTADCCPAATQDGMIVLLTVNVQGNRARVERARYLPIWVRHPDYTVLPVGPALRHGWADPRALRQSWQRTVSVVGRSVAQPTG
jgi:poly-gamma-glutamate synthesis protein (capsule biosynthesis protein)